MDRQLGLFDPANAEAVQQGRKDGGRKPRAAAAKGGAAAWEGSEETPHDRSGEGAAPPGRLHRLWHSAWSNELGKVKAYGHFR